VGFGDDDVKNILPTVWNSRNSKIKKNWTLLTTLKNGLWGKPSKKEFSRQARQQSEV
jgi:hypothetical protein